MHGLDTMKYLNEQAAAHQRESQSYKPRPFTVTVTRITEVPGWLSGDTSRESVLAEYHTDTHENALTLRALIEAHYAATRSLLTQNQGRQGIAVTVVNRG